MTLRVNKTSLYCKLWGEWDFLVQPHAPLVSISPAVENTSAISPLQWSGIDEVNWRAYTAEGILGVQPYGNE